MTKLYNQILSKYRPRSVGYYWGGFIGCFLSLALILILVGIGVLLRSDNLISSLVSLVLLLIGGISLLIVFDTVRRTKW